MHLDVNKLINVGACERGIKFFEKHYPDGAQLVDLIRARHMPRHYLYWGNDTFDLNREERAAYNEVLKLEHNDDAVDYSYDVSDSTFVSNSEDVHNSKMVYHSTEIKNCAYISNCTTVDNCEEVFDSQLVFDSNLVIDCTNVTNSHHIYRSQNVNDSQFVTYSSVVFVSEMIGFSQNIDNCVFCESSRDLKNCAFCYNLNNGTYMLFNKVVDPKVFESTMRMYDKIGVHSINLLAPGTSNQFCRPAYPELVSRKEEQYAQLPKKFIDWVKTLPNYDSSIMYLLTGRKEFL